MDQEQGRFVPENAGDGRDKRFWLIYPYFLLRRLFCIIAAAGKPIVRIMGNGVVGIWRCRQACRSRPTTTSTRARGLCSASLAGHSCAATTFNCTHHMSRTSRNYRLRQGRPVLRACRCCLLRHVRGSMLRRLLYRFLCSCDVGGGSPCRLLRPQAILSSAFLHGALARPRWWGWDIA